MIIIHRSGPRYTGIVPALARRYQGADAVLTRPSGQSINLLQLCGGLYRSCPVAPRRHEGTTALGAAARAARIVDIYGSTMNLRDLLREPARIVRHIVEAVQYLDDIGLRRPDSPQQGKEVGQQAAVMRMALQAGQEMLLGSGHITAQLAELS